MSAILDRLHYVWSHPANQGKRWGALLRATQWQMAKRLSAKPRDITVFGDMKLRCYPDSQSEILMLYTDGWYDWHEMGFMKHYLRPGDAFLDIGANVGIYSLLAASLIGPDAPIDAFEPIPATLARLRQNLLLNNLTQVAIHELAVGETEGRVSMVTGNGAMNHIAAAPEDEATTIDVPCVRLDDHLAGRQYAMGKIDIEGAEPMAFAGATAMLAASNPPVWLLEMNGLLHQFGTTEEAFANWLADHGYDLALYNVDRRELTFDPQPWRQSDNVLAVSRDKRQEVEARLAQE